jgi:hypothetical protein
VSSTAAVGWLLDSFFLLCLTLLPPARSWRELALVILATVSPMVAFALERANPDVILFLLVIAVGYLIMRPLPIRLLSYVVALFAASLKYYPITLMILTLRERIATFLAVNLAVLFMIALFVLTYFSELGRGIPLIASGDYNIDVFSAENLPWGIARGLERIPWAAEHRRLIVVGIYAVILIIGTRICWPLVRAGNLRAALAKLDHRELTFLMIGSILIVSCFFEAQNTVYRGIYFLCVLPGMLAISRNSSVRAIRALGTGTSAVIVVIMWGECIRRNLLVQAFDGAGGASPSSLLLISYFWLLRELAWWWLITVLTAILLEFVRGSQVVQAAWAFVPRRGRSHQRG